MTLISALDDMGCNKRQVFYVSWLEAHQRMEYADFVDRMVTIAKGYRVYIWASEINGVGAAPTQDLRRQPARRTSRGMSRTFWTDPKRKQTGYQHPEVGDGRRDPYPASRRRPDARARGPGLRADPGRIDEDRRPAGLP